jgi:hypothetical protein
LTLHAQLDSYCKAFNDRGLDTLLTLFFDHALFEMPLLGQRLVGKSEISAGLRRMFDVTESATITLSGFKQSKVLIIAEGQLVAKLRRDLAPVTIPLAISLQAQDGRISRLSTYLDARPHRLWSDGPIFAPSQASSH